MGIFPQIDRAWVTVDNRLYFWNYRNGSDFHTFDELDQSITAVALVPPKKGMFIDSITHVLVLSTSKDLYLIALSYNRANNELELFETGMTVAVSGLEVSTIVASKTTGRIFISGKTHGVNVSEINYTNVETWFKGKCTRTCHTSHAISAVLPTLTGYDRYQFQSIPIIGSFFKESVPETTVSMVIDDSRSLLYTLSNISTIRMYYLDPKKDVLRHLTTYTLSQIASHLRVNPLQNQQSGGLKAMPVKSIVGIHIIESKESPNLCLVAITSTGSRIYIKTLNHTDSANPPYNLQAVQQRSSPTTTDIPALDLLEGTASTSQVFAPGYYFAVVPTKNGEPGNAVFVSAPDSGKIITKLSKDSVPTYFENASFLDIEGFVQEICQVTPYSGTSPGFGNESAVQYIVPNPQVVIFTNTGVHIFTRKFPFQIFEEFGQDIQYFTANYSRAETCANALSVASRVSSFSSDECEFASKVFIEIGGKPRIKMDGDRTYLLSPNKSLNESSISSSMISDSDLIRLSGRFDGLATYVTRVIRALWNTRIFKATTTGGSSKKFSYGTDRKQLESIQLILLEITEYLDKNRTFIDGLSGGPESSILYRPEEICLKAEHRGLHALIALISSMKEGITFLILLIDESSKTTNGLESFTCLLPNDALEMLEAITFKSFFSTNQGKELAQQLITSMVNLSLSNGGTIDSISSVLQNRCASYCSSDDVVIQKAFEVLKNAESLSGSALTQALNESLILFHKGIGTIRSEVLRKIVDELVKYKFYPGAAELVLSVARDRDHGNLALEYYKDGRREDDSRKEYFEARFNIYELVFALLDAVDLKAQGIEVTPEGQLPIEAQLRDETYHVCYTSSDEIFHYCFYDWLMLNDDSSRLLQIDTPFILPYLEMKAKTDLTVANTLWLYHQKHENFSAAAEVLFVLAQSKFPLTLGDRIELLTRAITYCNCPCPPNLQPAVAKLGSTIQEYLDVANIQDEILRTVRLDDVFDSEKRGSIIEQLDNSLLTISDLFNNYAEPLNYYEIMLHIFQTTDYRGADEIHHCWDSLISSLAEKSLDSPQPFTQVSQLVQKLGKELQLSEFVFPVAHLISLLESCNIEYSLGAPNGWIVDTFVKCGLSFEALLSIFEGLLISDSPFDDPVLFNKLALEAVYALQGYTKECEIQNLQRSASPELLKILETTYGKKL